MGAQQKKNSIALLVRSAPGSSRESRAEVDFALAALSLDFELEVYFTGDAILQLVEEKDAAPALLPGGYKAWSALPELGEVNIFGESGWLNRLARLGIPLALPVEGLDLPRMKQRWRRCGQVLVL